jgi:hypothetical protein
MTHSSDTSPPTVSQYDLFAMVFSSLAILAEFADTFFVAEDDVGLLILIK